MLSGNDRPELGREAHVARTGQGRTTRNAVALPLGSIIVIDELGRPLKQLSVSMEINKKPSRNAKTDDFGRLYPLAGDIDEVTVKVTDSHESGVGDSLATESGQHFERGGDGPRVA